MHNANAFHNEVSAYPAITIIRKDRQGKAVVAGAQPEVEQQGSSAIAAAIEAVRAGERSSVSGLTVATVKTWFTGTDPWPCSSPKRLALLRRIEEQFDPLETDDGGTKVGIGVATGLDNAFITKDKKLVEESRLLPIALARDTLTGHLQ